MSEEAGFVAALVAAPTDLTTALVFADWLEERGDPRGPMLRSDEVRAWMHPGYENPVPGLAQALESGKKVTQASKVLALIGAPAVPTLLALIAHPEPNVQVRAVKVLRLMSSRAGGALAALMALVRSARYSVRSEAFAAAAEIARSGTADVAPLREALHDPDSAVRQWTASLLNSMRATSDVKSELAKGLGSADEAERLAALSAMSNLNTVAGAGELCRALTDPSTEVRRAAAKQLRQMADARTTKLVEPLHKALADPDADVRRSAASALGEIGPAAAVALPDLLRLLPAADAPEQGPLISVLGRIGSRDPAVRDAILGVLPAAGESVRPAAVTALTRWPELPPSVAPLLLECLRGLGNSHWRHDGRQLLTALAKIVPLPPEVRDEFRTRLNGNWAPVVAGVLGDIGPAAAPFLPDLIAIFKPGTASLTAIGRALGKIGGDGIAVLVAALDSPVPANGFNALPGAALEGLQAAGSQAVQALPALLARLRQPLSAADHSSVLRAIRGLGPGAASAGPDLITMFLDEQVQDPFDGFSRALEAFGPEVVPFVPQLTEALGQPAREPRHAPILRLLAGLIPHGAEVLPAFRDALRRANSGEWYAGDSDRRLYVARAAIDGLAAVGAGAAAALPELALAYRTFTGTPPGDAREAVLAVYGKIGGDLVPVIRAALTDPSWRIRVAAVRALGDTGDTSADTHAALRALETDASSKVRARAVAVLKKLDAPAKKRKRKA